MTASTAPTNLPEISVSELSQSLKRTVEEAFPYVRLRGEISGYRGPHSSGHCYFSLKDDRARIEAVIWKGNFARMRVKPEEGLDVVATGKITTFPGSSKYQIVIDTIEPAGVGALMALLEERRKKLAAEGLFDEGRKKPLPYLPRVIGVVTSPTGAVIRDILHRLSDRFPRHVLVWPVRVQGETCGAEVAAAIEGFNAMQIGGALPRPELLIVARGGGSLEDLWGFNDEVVVRAAAASAIPLISAVGHETDFTLIDFAADRRAPTPTAAAEMAVPVRSELIALSRDRAARLVSCWSRMIERLKTELRGLARGVPSLDSLLAMPRQRLDACGAALPRALRANAHAHRVEFSTLAAKHMPHALRVRLERYRERGDALAERAFRARGHTLKNARTRLDGLSQLLRAFSHKSVLDRGFALVRGPDGHPLNSVAMASPGAGIEIEVKDGRFGAIVSGTAPAAPKKSAAPPARKPSGQGSLFGE
ncbi:MAG: exodeoxyribonuclease VII large subunit [Xanthobacteraceae bacterium]|nr:exodeoxyribonuclease VII large subunit [Xanthobacteraceae bacterium]